MSSDVNQLIKCLLNTRYLFRIGNHKKKWIGEGWGRESRKGKILTIINGLKGEERWNVYSSLASTCLFRATSCGKSASHSATNG